MARHNGLSFYKRRKKISTTVIREIFGWLFGIFASVFLGMVFTWFFGMTTWVVGVSMEPALYSGQRIFINRFIYTFVSPKSGDVVVFLPNGNENSHYYVKRVLAEPGDKVQITGGVVYVNGQESEWVTEKVLDPGIAANEYTLKTGEYFVMGDNSNNSEDSRSANIGPVKKEDIVGQAWFHMQSESGGIGFVK